jgi:hypothetical protein
MAIRKLSTLLGLTGLLAWSIVGLTMVSMLASPKAEAQMLSPIEFASSLVYDTRVALSNKLEGGIWRRKVAKSSHGTPFDYAAEFDQSLSNDKQIFVKLEQVLDNHRPHFLISGMIVGVAAEDLRSFESKVLELLTGQLDSSLEVIEFTVKTDGSFSLKFNYKHVANPTYHADLEAMKRLLEHVIESARLAALKSADL